MSEFSYKTQQPPNNVDALPGFLSQELERIEAHLAQLDLSENPRWESLTIPAHTMKAGATAVPDFGVVTGVLQTYLFDSTAQESLHFSAVVPRGYREESNLKPYVNWCPTTTSSGSVKFELVYAWADTGSTLASLTLTAAQAVSLSYAPTATALGTIAGAGRHIGSVLIGRLSRLSSDVSDTYSYDVGVIALELRYERDADGSRRETIK